MKAGGDASEALLGVSVSDAFADLMLTEPAQGPSMPEGYYRRRECRRARVTSAIFSTQGFWLGHANPGRSKRMVGR
jgi:hypothetical protein